MLIQGTIIFDYVCLFYILENGMVVLVEILWDSIPAIKNTLTRDLFIFEKNSERKTVSILSTFYLLF